MRSAGTGLTRTSWRKSRPTPATATAPAARNRRDGFCPLGSEVVGRDEIADPHALPLRLLVNGEVRQQNSTANLVRSISKLIAEISEFMTLHAGDVLITGTPEGRVDVQPGDEVVVEIEGLGRLVNHVVAEEA